MRSSTLIAPAEVWWRPGPPSPPPHVGSPDADRLSFAALAVFTMVLLVSPQAWLPALGPLRIALVAGAVAIVANLAGGGWRRSSRTTRQGLWAAAVLVAWIVVTAPWSLWPGGSLATLMDPLLKALAFFWLTATVLTTTTRLRRFVWILAWCALPLAGSAIYNFVAGVFLDGGTASTQRILGYRGSALAENPNDLALTLNLLIPFIVVAAALARTWTGRLVAVAALAACVVAVLLTFSRGGAVTLAAMALVTAAGTFSRHPLATTLVVALALLAMPLLPAAYLDRLTTIAAISTDATGSAQDRWRDMGAAVDIASRYPITGVGLGQSVLALNIERGATWRIVHNAYLQYAVDLGLPGLAIFVWLLVTAFKSALHAAGRRPGFRRPGDLPVVARGTVVALVAFSVAAVFQPVAYQFYVFLVAGLALAVGSALQRVQSGRVPAPPAVGWAAAR